MAIQRFADSTFWIALFNQADPDHEAAVRAIQEIGRQPGAAHSLVISDYVFDEVVTTIRYRMRRHDRAVAAGQTLLESRLSRLVTVTDPTFNRAWQMFASRKDKKWSFTDCTSFVIMQDLALREAVAFDRDFRTAGFSTVP